VNPTDPLAALHPLRDPAPIPWWPPAPGWWLLFALALIAMSLLIWWFLRRRRRNAYRRRALARLQELRALHPGDTDAQAYTAAVNALLKSVALIAYPRREVAARSGGQWLEFLRSTAPAGEHFPDGFADAGYRAGLPGIDLEQSYRAAAHWLKHHEVHP